MKIEFGISREGTRMPFGRYKGQKLDVIPDSYLNWCLDNLSPVKWESLLKDIDKTLDEREEEILSEEEEFWEYKAKYFYRYEIGDR